MNSEAISICIPTYKRPINVERLLNSIRIQSFKNYEIIIADDSPDNSIQSVLENFSQLPIIYYKNDIALGTPANWNFAISKANGEWIKIMHDDDWFANNNSLELFLEKAKEGNKFIFSSYNNVFEKTNSIQRMIFPHSWKVKILKNPLTLLPRNVIGPPSVTMVHRSILHQYDTNMKWRVDIDFYIRILKDEKTFSYINQPLVNVGINGTQVTNFCINKPEVELPEGLLLLNKYCVFPLKNILVYDAWWRILRNVHVRNKQKLFQYTPNGDWPEVIMEMINHQSYIPSNMLRWGVISKLSMFLSYIFNRKYLQE